VRACVRARARVCLLVRAIRAATAAVAAIRVHADSNAGLVRTGNLFYTRVDTPEFSLSLFFFQLSHNRSFRYETRVYQKKSCTTVRYECSPDIYYGDFSEKMFIPKKMSLAGLGFYF